MIAGLLVGAIFLWLAIRDVELAAVIESLKGANLWLTIPFVASLTLFYWLKAIRWSYLLQPTRRISPGVLVPSMMIGFAGNNVLPVRLGELLRIYALGRQQNLAKSTILGTVVLERVFDVVSILVLVTVAMYATPSTTPEFDAARRFMLVGALLSVSTSYAIAASPAWLVSILTPVIGLLPQTARHLLQNKLLELRRGFAILTDSPGHTLAKVTLNSLFQWALLAACIYLAIMAFDVAATPAVAVLILGLVVAGISLPSAPGFVGTIEYCFVLGLGLFGVSPDIALSVGIYYHAITFIAVTLSGAYYLRRFDSSLGKMAKAASSVKDDGS